MASRVFRRTSRINSVVRIHVKRFTRFTHRKMSTFLLFSIISQLRCAHFRYQFKINIYPDTLPLRGICSVPWFEEASFISLSNYMNTLEYI